MKKITFIVFFLIILTLEGNSQCWQSISTGDNHILAVKKDGTLWAWGSNNYGKCGPNFQNYTNIPAQVGNENNWQKPSAGFYHSMVTKTNDKLYGWGINWEGEIGIGTSGLDYSIINYYSQISNDIWSSVSAGYDFTIAIKTDGTLWNWGDGILVPTQIGNDSDWDKIASGSSKKCFAIKTDGTLWTWRPNYYNMTQIGISNNWQVITNSYGIKTDGTLWEIPWEISETPVQIGTKNNWMSIYKGYSSGHQLAIKLDGTLWAWGENNYGELGDGTNISKTDPIQIGSNSDWTFISAGERYSLALNSSGELWTWGANFFGQLGDGSFTDKNIQTLINCPSLSLTNINTKNIIKLYPNPIKNFLNINTRNINVISKILISDITGKTIIEVNKNITKINIEKLKTGVYFVFFTAEKGNYIGKFIKN